MLAPSPRIALRFICSVGELFYARLGYGLDLSWLDFVMGRPRDDGFLHLSREVNKLCAVARHPY